MELFIRKANLRLYERSWPELASETAPGARAMVNRAAFHVLADAAILGLPLANKLDFVRDNNNIQAAELALVGAQIFSAREYVEVAELARRMCYNLFGPDRGDVILSPKFSGCGIINACSGDALENGCHIVELKDGDRAFRSYEFRQLSIYSALHLNSTGLVPNSVEVINSRRGVGVTIGIEEFADEVAGQSAYDFLREIIRFISDITLSR